jgi:hypothetical protein
MRVNRRRVLSSALLSWAVYCGGRARTQRIISSTESEPPLKVATGEVLFFAVSGESMAARIVAGAVLATLMSALFARLSMYIESSRAPPAGPGSP